MTVTTTTLTRAAGLAAVAGGLLFVGVQINHPPLDVALVTTTEWVVRESAKVAFAVLSLVGITGMYLRQVKQAGVLGLLGYLLLGTAFLAICSIQVVGVGVLPGLALTEPGYVSDVLAVSAGGAATGDVGLLGPLNQVASFTFLAGGLLFGIALFRAKVLARWAAALLAAGALAPIAILVLPQLNPRLFAIPTGVALACLGYSLWREQRTNSVLDVRSSQFDPAGAR